jgi:hypothetical protein
VRIGNSQKLRGYRSALLAAGIEPDPALEVPPEGFGHADGFAAAAQLFRRAPDATALFASTDQLAIGALAWLALNGRDVPGDVSVVGFDDTEASRFCLPPLTSVVFDSARVARESVRRLIDLIDGAGTDAASMRERTVIPPTISIRASSGPLPGSHITPWRSTVKSKILLALAFALSSVVLAQTTITWWSPNFHSDRAEVLLERFHELNPDIRVNLEVTVADGLQNRILVALQSGTGPDLIDVANGWNVPFALTGGLYALDERIAASGLPLDDFLQPALGTATVDGVLYGLPFRVEAHALIYNRDAYREAGLDPDAPPQTWDELLETAEALDAHQRRRPDAVRLRTRWWR